MKKLTQKQQIFYRLLVERKLRPVQYMPIWQFIGEFHIAEADQWGFISYEVSARMSELWREIPDGVIQREIVTGRSGAKYYSYRINPELNRATLLGKYLLPQYEHVVLLFGAIQELDNKTPDKISGFCDDCAGVGKVKYSAGGTIVQADCKKCNGRGLL